MQPGLRDKTKGESWSTPGTKLAALKSPRNTNQGTRAHSAYLELVLISMSSVATVVLKYSIGPLVRNLKSGVRLTFLFLRKETGRILTFPIGGERLRYVHYFFQAIYFLSVFYERADTVSVIGVLEHIPGITVVPFSLSNLKTSHWILYKLPSADPRPSRVCFMPVVKRTV